MVPSFFERHTTLQSRSHRRSRRVVHVADRTPVGSLTRAGEASGQRLGGNQQPPVARAARRHRRSLLL